MIYVDSFPGLLSVCLLAGMASAAERPNVLLLYIDDLKPMTRDYGHPHMVTPNFDRLAAGGTRFESAYCQIPTCGASRGSLMTSLYPTRERFKNFKIWAERDAPDAPTLPQRFREAGYVTISNGKVFHHQADTNDRSWSEPAWRPKTTGRTYWNEETAAFLRTSTFFKGGQAPPKKKKNGKVKKAEKKLPMFEKSEIDPLLAHDGLIAAKTMSDLERLAAGDKPFFIACGFAKPHMPFYAPRESWEYYTLSEVALAEHRRPPLPTPGTYRNVREQFAYEPMTHDFTRPLPYNSDGYHEHMRQGYYACVTFVDGLVGHILEKLDKLSLADDTIVVTVGDHGWLLGEHDEWAKNQLLHEAVRTAMWMRGPGIARGAEADTFVEFVDIHPTLCGLAGIPYDAKSIHGREFTAVLKEPGSEYRTHAYTRFDAGDAVATKDYFFVRYESSAHGLEYLLVDRDTDPDHQHNVAADASYATVVGELDDLTLSKIETASGLSVSR
ncbi:MAG: sulfatase [Planctomycetota bacterium]